MSWIRNVIVLCVFSLGGLASSEPVRADPVGAPLPCNLPWSWTVQEDYLLTVYQVAEIGERLGGKLQAVRNTKFDVGSGRVVQVNVLVTASPADAETVLDGIFRIKPREFVVAHGTVLFELVGRDEVLPEMRQAATRLRAFAASEGGN